MYQIATHAHTHLDSFHTPPTVSEDVSVVVTAMVDAERLYINDCINSVLQNKHIAEVIVCVEKSNTWIDDELRNFLDNSKLKILRLFKCNAATARNYGVKVSVSEWVAFCDGDDFWSEQKIEKQREFALANTMDVVGGDHWLTNMKGKVKSYALCRTMPMTSSWLVSRKLIRAYPFNENLDTAEDSEWWLRMGNRIKKGRCPHLMLYYRVRTNTQSSGSPSKQRKTFVVRLASIPLLDKLVMIGTFLCWMLLRRSKYSL